MHTKMAIHFGGHRHVSKFSCSRDSDLVPYIWCIRDSHWGLIFRRGTYGMTSFERMER